MSTTWKKVLTEDSSIPTSQISGVGTANAVPFVDGSGDLSEVVLTNGQFLGGRDSSTPAATTFGGTNGDGSDITATLSSNKMLLTVNDGAIDQDAMAENAIGMAQLAGSGSGLNVIVYDSSGDPTLLAPSSGNQVLKTNSNNTAFVFGADSDSSTISVAANNADSALPVFFGGVNDTDADSNVTVQKDGAASTFTYNPGVSYSVASGQAAVGSVSGGTAALTVAEGIKGDLLGTATFAGAVNAATDASDSFQSVYFGPATGYTDLHTDTGITYNPAEDTLKVGNLIVNGNNTVLNTTNLNVEDHTIRVAVSPSSTSTSTNAGSGLVVNVGISDVSSTDEDNATLNQTNPDNFLPRLIWSDGANTTKGWAIATVGAADATAGQTVGGVAIDDNLKTASTLHGVAVMHHTTDAYASATDVNNNIGDIGVGAFYLSTNGTGNLYVQIA